MNRTTEMIGLTSGALTTFSFVPQAVAVWRRVPSPVPDVSLTTYAVLAVGIVGWIVYGVRIRSFAVKMWNAITLAIAVGILAYKLIYG